MSTTNKTLIFKKVPNGAPVPGQDLVVEDRGFDASAPAPEGGVTLSVLYVSFDPYQRGRMRPADVPSYTPAFDLDGPVTNAAVARVLKSANPGYAAGDLVLGALPTAEYVVLRNADEVAATLRRKLTDTHGVKDLGLFLGPLGMPGLTAYSSLFEIGKPKKGETIFISSAAGAVGAMVGQMCKRLGLRVIGSVGSQEKLDFIVNELGFDGGFNYKTESAQDALKRLAPDGLDIYYENVGGEQLQAALHAMNMFGRVIVCGMISEYNKPVEEQTPIRGLFLLVIRRITMRGFLVFDEDFGPKYAKEHQENVAKWLAEGSMKAKLSVTDGIDHAAEGFCGMLAGKNFGKAVLKVKDE